MTLVSNNGPDDSSGAALSIDLPNGALKALSATVGDGSYDRPRCHVRSARCGGGSTDVHLVIAAKRMVIKRSAPTWIRRHRRRSGPQQ